MLWERKPRFRFADPSTSSCLDLTIRRGRVIEGPLVHSEAGLPGGGWEQETASWEKSENGAVREAKVHT